MNRTISTYEDLCEERERLKNLQSIQRQRVKDNWGELKEEFTPVKNAFGVFGKMTSPDKSNPLLNMGLKVATDLFISKFVLGRAGWAIKMAVPFVVRNYASHQFAEKGKGLISKLGKIFRRKDKDPGPVTAA